MTNRQLAKPVQGKIATRTVSTYVSQADPPFTTQRYIDQEPEEKTEEQKAECKTFLNKIKHKVRIEDRVYEDECAVFSNEAKKKGQGRKGKPLYRTHTRYAKKYCLHVWAKKQSVIFWELRDQNADDRDFKTVALRAVKNLKRGETVIWDRLGKSGRCLHPTAQHYNPEVVNAINNCGAKVVYHRL